MSLQTLEEAPLAPHRYHVLGAKVDHGAGSRKIPSCVHAFSWPPPCHTP